VFNGIIDIYHENPFDIQKVLADGVTAVIHKATEGTTMQDEKYHDRRQEAKAAGLLWGAYHFSSGADVAKQVGNFLSFAQPTDDELISLDWEPSSKAGDPDMSVEQARAFVTLIKEKTGRWPVIYGGHLLRESVGDQPDAVLANCPLWYVRYAPTPKAIPTAIWPTYTLWQYTDGKDGFLQPIVTDGASGADRNTFQGTAEELAASWPFTRADA
jgi:lysozyme